MSRMMSSKLWVFLFFMVGVSFYIPHFILWSSSSSRGFCGGTLEADKSIPTGPPVKFHKLEQHWTDKCREKLEIVQEMDIAAGETFKNKTNAVVFLKTHKTGSSTVQNILLRYGDKNDLVFVLPGTANYVLRGRGIPKFLLPCEKEKPDIMCLHTDYKPQQLIHAVKKNATFITILRNPDTLFLSMYQYYNLEKYFNKSVANFLERPPKTLKGRIIPATFTSIGVNQMIRDLGMENVDTEKHDRVDQYITELESLYNLVMITEKMSESLILMRHLLGWDLLDVISLPLNQRRIGSENGLTSLTQHQRLNLHNLNAADHSLYKKFSKKFEDKLAAFGHERMRAELDAYHCLNDAVYKACQVESYRAIDLPKIYKPYGDTVGFFPAVRYNMSHDLLWLCPRITSVELSYIEQLRLKQRYTASITLKGLC